jgi:hypothetical protein
MGYKNNISIFWITLCPYVKEINLKFIWFYFGLLRGMIPLKHVPTLGHFSLPIKMLFLLAKLIESGAYLWAQIFKIIFVDLADLGLLSDHFRRKI